MCNTTRIPDEAKRLILEANSEQQIDTKGLECILKPDRGDIFVRPTASSISDAYLVRVGEEFCFSGKVIIYSKAEADAYYMLFRTL